MNREPTHPVMPKVHEFDYIDYQEMMLKNYMEIFFYYIDIYKGIFSKWL